METYPIYLYVEKGWYWGSDRVFDRKSIILEAITRQHIKLYICRLLTATSQEHEWSHIISKWPKQGHDHML